MAVRRFPSSWKARTLLSLSSCWLHVEIATSSRRCDPRLVQAVELIFCGIALEQLVDSNCQATQL